MTTRTIPSDPRDLLRGAGTFIDDAMIPGRAIGIFVRSPHAHAVIRGIETDTAAAMPGVLGILTAADLLPFGLATLSRPVPLKNRDGSPLIAPTMPALAGDRVRHVGEAVALVVAETASAAMDAAEMVEVDYEPLPVVTDATAALLPDAPQLWPEAPGNLALDWPGPGHDAEKHAEAARRIVAGAPRVVRIRVVNQRLAGVPMEARGATAAYDAKTGRYTLHAPSQGAGPLRAQLAAILGVPHDALRVISGDVGGAFGLKTPAYPEYVALLVAARLLGRPIHWMSTRSEAFLSDTQGRDNVSEAALALGANGRFLALDVTAVVNLGAYAAGAGPIIATNGFANCFPTVYDIPHVGIGVRLVFTNTVPTSAYRGAGRPEANYLMERLVDAAARETGIDPIELRRRNLIAPSAMPWHSPVGTVYDSGEFDLALTRALERAEYASFAARRAEAEQRGRLRGIGISAFLEHAGGPGDEGAALSVGNGMVTVRLGVHSSGQGHARIYRQIAAGQLGIPPERITVLQGDSDYPIRGGPAVGSRSTGLAGAAVIKAAGELVAAAREEAGERLEAATADIEYANGMFTVAGTNRTVSLFDLAEGRNGRPALAVVSHTVVPQTYPNGCHIAEVEIDPQTGAVAVIAYTAVDDCGVVLDDTLAEAQVVGGIVQGLGQALCETVIYDADGQMLTGSLLDYAMPRADDVPMIASLFSPVPCRTNALGVKGVGEAGSTAAMAAIMNAIADALPDGRGAAIDMPATAEKVWRACRGA